ncbi:MAG: thioredoxin [Mycoplasmataceae bacterium]|nr:thioredoxin [Mycoplasmataceae bacterium]
MLKIIQNENELDSNLEGNELLIVNFFAPWCGPCKMFAPVLEKYANDNNQLVLKIDIDQFSDLAIKHKIQGVPTTVIFKNGKEVDRTSGFLPQKSLENFIQKNK